MVELLYCEEDIFADFRFEVQMWKEWDKHVICVSLYWKNWNMYRMFEWEDKTDEEIIKKCDNIMRLMRQMRVTCWKFLIDR